MGYVSAIMITAFIVGFITWSWTKSTTENEFSYKWTLGICNDENGWQALLERSPNNRAWEYIYINEDNLPLIRHIAFLNTPTMSNPAVSYKEDKINKMLQDMVNRGHGHISGIEKDPTSRYSRSQPGGPLRLSFSLGKIIFSRENIWLRYYGY